MKRLLAALLARVDGRDLPPTEWLRVGWPRGLIVLLVTLPAIVAGPIRFLTGVGFGWAYLGGALLSLAVVAPFARALRGSSLSTPQELFAHAIVLVVAAFAGVLTYNRHFHGLPQYMADKEWGGIDGAYHLMNFMDFVHRTHDVYGGFVSMYTFWDFTRRLGSTHLLVGLNICFAFVRVLVAVAPCVVAFAVLHRFARERRAWWAGACVCLLATIATQYFVVLPLLNFHLMGGFWPHLFGFVPLMLLWLADVLVRPRLLRLLVLLGCAVLYRYTYGLNLPDLLVAIAVILLVEAASRRPEAWWVRVLLVAVALLTVWVSRYCWILAARLWNDWGWIIEHDVRGAENGQLAALGAFALSIAPWPARAGSSGIARALRFPLLFGAANVMFLRRIEHITPRTFYYFQKYDLHAVVLVAAALVVVVTWWTALVAARATAARVAGALLALALAVAGTGIVHRAIAAYDDCFHEQAVGGESYTRSYPWVMPGTVAFIDRMLAKEHKAFGGYFAKHWAMRVATNALYDFGDRNWMHHPRLLTSPGHCVFWERNYSRFPVYDVNDARTCEKIFQQPFGKLEVCALCF